MQSVDYHTLTLRLNARLVIQHEHLTVKFHRHSLLLRIDTLHATHVALCVLSEGYMYHSCNFRPSSYVPRRSSLSLLEKNTRSCPYISLIQACVTRTCVTHVVLFDNVQVRILLSNERDSLRRFIFIVTQSCSTRR